MRSKTSEKTVIFADLLVFLVSFLCSIYIRYGNEGPSVLFNYDYSMNIGILLLYLVLYVLVILSLKGMGGYKLGRNVVEQLIYVIRNQSALLILIIFFAFVTQRSMSFSRRFVAYTFAISMALDLVVRSLMRRQITLSAIKIAGEGSEETASQSIFTIDEHVVRELQGDCLPNNKSFGDYRHVFAIGCKGIPASYGGFESFMDNLTRNRMNSHLMYHVARISTDDQRFEYNDSVCFDIPVPDIGAAKAIVYDCYALGTSIKYCRRHPEIKNPVFFIMACRIGPFISYYKKKIEKLGGYLYVNPDGHEWKRAKWNRFIKKYWKISERLMVKHADLLICDSKNIESYIKEHYKAYHPATTFIPYGSDMQSSVLPDDNNDFCRWLRFNHLSKNDYYVMVGRFVPENNYETAIREFMKSNTKKKLAIITTENGKYYEELKAKLHFESDKRIRFTGTVYNDELLKKIRENAFAYIHGHEVGGTNPSLLEALSSTRLNLLNDVKFNVEVGEEAALYWNKEEGNLKELIEKVELFDEDTIEEYGKKAKKRIEDDYLWNETCEKYERVFDA